MPGEQLIGRVAVKVLPDTSDFRRRAKAQLDAIEKGLEVQVGAKLDGTGLRRDILTEVRKINQENRASDARKVKFYTKVDATGVRSELAQAVRRLQAQADTIRRIQIKTDLVAADAKLQLDKNSLRDVKRELDHWRRDNSPIKIDVKPNFVQGSGTPIAARLAVLTRPRTVSIVPVLNQGAYGQVLTALSALSGARLLSTIFDDVWKSLSRLDKNIPIIGTLALAVAGLSGWATAAASNLFALSSTLAQIGPAALALPGIFGGIAIGIGLSIVALRDFNTQVPQAKAAMTQLGDVISKNFWAGAAEPIRNFVDVLLPEVTRGVAATATELGGYWGALAASLAGVFNGALEGMFADLAKSIEIAKSGTGALAGIIKNLGEVGAGYLPQLARWFVDITTQFDSFISKAAGDGRLGIWIDTALVQLSALGSSIASISAIFAAIATAATNAGGSGLQTFADTLNQIQATVQGPVFQQGLTAVFASAHQAMSLIATNSGPQVERLFKELGQVLQTVLPIAGSAIGTALGAIANGLSQVEVPAGLVMMFDGLRKGIEALAPAMAPLGSALGALLSLIGTMAAAFGPLLAAAIVPLAGALQALAPVVGQIVTLLAGTLTQVIQGIGPVFAQAAQGVASFATSSGGTIEALGAVFAALGPVLVQIGQQLVGIIGPVFVALAPVVMALATALGTVLTAVAPLASALLGLVGSVLVPLAQIIGGVLSAALPKLGEAFANLANALMPVVAAIQAVVNFLLPVLIPVLTFLANLIVNAVIGAINGLATAISGVVTFFTGLWNIVAGLFTGNWGQLWEGVKQVFVGAWDFIKGVFQVVMNVGILRFAGLAMSGLKALFTGGWAGIKALWSAAVAGLKSLWGQLPQFMLSVIRAPFATIKGLFSALGSGIRSIVQGAWTAIQTIIRNVMMAIGTVVSTYINLYRSLISAGMGAIRAAFSAAFTVVKAIVTTAWGAIKGAFTTGISNVKALMSGLPAGLRSALGNVKDILLNAGRSIIGGLITGISERIKAVKSKLSELTNLIPSWKGPRKKDAKLLYDAGRLIMDGLIKGMSDNFSKVKSALQGLTAKLPKDASASLKRAVGGDRTALLGLAAQWEAVSTKVKAAADAAANVRAEAKKYFDSVKEAILDTGDIGKTEDTTFKGITERLKKARDEATRFAELLGKLAKAGLNKETFDQIVQAGPGLGSSLAESILASGARGIKEINALQQRLAAAAAKAAGFATDKMYASGIAMASGLVAGLKKQQKAIEDQMIAIAKSMVGAIKKALGIKSPSRVMRQLGEYTGLGVKLGLQGGLDDSLQIFKDFARDLMAEASAIDLAGVQAPSLNAALGDAAGSSQGTMIRQLNYYAAPGSSLDSEEDLFGALDRARAGW